MSKHNQNAQVIRETKNVTGLLTLTYEHEVKSTKYTFDWKGPKIPREEWQKILAFFKWTYDTTKSESQVRLYVNCREDIRTWKAWAFPQKMNGGMSAKELDTPETATQRAQFSDADGWLYFGTVHHHCSASAFQSGVDENNEKNQDGLHITVGNLDKELYDIDARVYIGGNKLNHSLSMFWQVDGVIAGLPSWVKDLLPKDADTKAAKRQMGEPAPADCTFPEVWKTNLVHEPVSIQVPRVVQTYYAPNNNGAWTFKPGYITRSSSKLPFDLNRATEEIEMWMIRQDAKKNADPATKNEPDWDLEAVVQCVYEIAGKLHDEEMELLDILCRNDTLPENWMTHAEQLIERRAQRELEEEIKKGDAKSRGETIGQKLAREQEELQQQWQERGW